MGDVKSKHIYTPLYTYLKQQQFQSSMSSTIILNSSLLIASFPALSCWTMMLSISASVISLPYLEKASFKLAREI